MQIEFPVTVTIQLNVKYTPEIEPIDIQGELSGTEDIIAEELTAAIRKEYPSWSQTQFVSIVVEADKNAEENIRDDIATNAILSQYQRFHPM